MGVFDRIRSTLGSSNEELENFECQSCGETYELKQTICQKCGSDRVVDTA